MLHVFLKKNVLDAVCGFSVVKPKKLLDGVEKSQ